MKYSTKEMIEIDIEEKKLNMKKIVIVVSIILFIIAIVIMISLYISERGFREWVDINILRKNLTEEDISTINLNIEKSNQVYVYEKYIALLNDKKITLYNSFGEEQDSIDVNINSALFDSNGKYLVVAEKNGNEVYLIQDRTYLWNNKVDGQILQVNVNYNGYVGVITTDTTYKSILTVYDYSGKQLFKSFFANTRIVDISISDDNKYIAIGELDASGAMIQSNLKVLSIENAKEGKDAFIYTYNANSGNLMTNIEYQDKGNIVCMYDSSIDVINNQNNRNLINTESGKIMFWAIEFSNNIVYIEEESDGLFKSKSNVKIKNTSTGQETLYVLDEPTKDIYANDDIIAVNTGSELYFIDTKGWLIKKYTSKQEITNVIFSSDIATIIYKDKIVIIDL